MDPDIWWWKHWIVLLTIWCPCHCFWSKRQELCRKLLFSSLDRAWLLEAETICVNSSHLRYVRHFCQMFTSFGPISERPLLDCCPDFLGYVFFNFYSNGGGSWYQNSVKACLTIGGLVGRFWSPLKFPTFLPPSFKLSVEREELRNGHFHEDAETFGDRIRLSVILRNINQRDIRRDAFQDTHTLRPAKNWKSWNGKFTSPTCVLKYSDIR